MFDSLMQRLSGAFTSLRGQSRFTEDNTQKAFSEIRLSLLEADVALPVVKQFIEQVKQKTLGQAIENNLTADQALVKIVHDELINILGGNQAKLNFNTQPPAVILMAGLQGSGKTTTSAKLARHLKEIENKKVMLVSVDVYRPAAIEQLKLLAEQIDVVFHPSHSGEKPVAIAKAALDSARKQYLDVVILDTAGRLHIDAEMMAEIKTLHQAVNPIETLFVVDSMTGQDAANTAKAFHEALPLTGVILTKTDGDARGGAALSVNYITGKPIKFMGIGEKIDALEPFYPDRVASRIVGMGDVLSLIEAVERGADKESGAKLAKKLQKGKGFDLEDLKQQLLQMNNMGGVAGMISKLPGMGQLQQAMNQQVNDKVLAQTVAIINSMTMKERRNPLLIKNSGSRKKRITKGSGTTVAELNQVLARYKKMREMWDKFNKPGKINQMMRGLGGLPGLKGMFPGNFK